MSEINPSEFRRALGRFATGVTIITTRDQAGTPVGITANSFNSVSLDPPMVLWSLARTANSLEAFMTCDHFAVHILAAHQIDLSNKFASRGIDKFAGQAVTSGLGGVPLLDDYATRFQCRTLQRHDGGDHIIFVGEVLDFSEQDAPPLLFHGGSYASLGPSPAAPQS
ncbi:flavin reductase family protein [Emcibacter sp.]|uniref:flavin reductase family protein n=1 Tax=Emcibacter sp. TaxID=1979954 RepID=UPI002AA7204E|nr:flavin reductase family protein [Emcibacter sp.]